MQKFTLIGTDISKLTLDHACTARNLYIKVKNNQEGFEHWLKWALSFATIDSLWVVMEHTGYYSYQFELYLQSLGIRYSKIAALEIKRSTGLARGKSDKADAGMISRYAHLRINILQPETAPVQLIASLKDMISLREKLVSDRSGYKSRLKEQQACRHLDPSDLLWQLQHQMIVVFTDRIREADRQIQLLIRRDAKLYGNYKLLLTIKGIGPVTAAYILCCTVNFTKFSNSRQFACYAGLAPFEHRSGTSIRGRSRVSHYANKRAKSLLILSALVAVRFNDELKEYYQRRVREGKNKMSVLNIVRNKLVDRMFAVIKRQTPYQQNIPCAA